MAQMRDHHPSGPFPAMPNQTARLFSQWPRYPEWGEMLCALLGILQFAFAMANFNDWDDRPGLALTVFLSPETWSVAGLILCLMHIGSLRFKGTKNGNLWRIFATGSSFAFWCHFILTIFVNALMTSSNIPGTLIPSLAAPLLAGAVLFRLWKHYD